MPEKFVALERIYEILFHHGNVFRGDDAHHGRRRVFNQPHHEFLLAGRRIGGRLVLAAHRALNHSLNRLRQGGRILRNQRNRNNAGYERGHKAYQKHQKYKLGLG